MMPLFKRGISREIAGAQDAAVGADVARTLRLIARLVNDVSASDLALADDGVQDALDELGASGGFARVVEALQRLGRDERTA